MRVLCVLCMLTYLSSGHMTLLRGEFQPLKLFHALDLLAGEAEKSTDNCEQCRRSVASSWRRRRQPRSNLVPRPRVPHFTRQPPAGGHHPACTARRRPPTSVTRCGRTKHPEVRSFNAQLAAAAAASTLECTLLWQYGRWRSWHRLGTRYRHPIHAPLCEQVHSRVHSIRVRIMRI